MNWHSLAGPDRSAVLSHWCCWHESCNAVVWKTNQGTLTMMRYVFMEKENGKNKTLSASQHNYLPSNVGRLGGFPGGGRGR